tara:strand:+ start:114 stop:818 length:705 start_codon:yes stop_codon:yes gene_type:complete
MPTLAEQITEATDRMTDLADYYQAQRGLIDQAVADAIAVAPLTFKTFYVDQIDGDDANVGDAAAPLKTVEEADRRAQTHGALTIYLVGDYEFTKVEKLATSAIWLRAAVPGSTTIRWAAEIDGVQILPPRIQLDTTCYSLNFANVTIELSDRSPHVTTNGMIVTTLFTAVFFSNVTFSAIGGDQAVFHADGGVGIRIRQVIDANVVAGRWIDGVVTGTDPTEVSILAFTNLASL